MAGASEDIGGYLVQTLYLLTLKMSDQGEIAQVKIVWSKIFLEENMKGSSLFRSLGPTIYSHNLFQ